MMLGERHGRAYAVGAISEFMEPCDDAGARTVRLNRVLVSDISLERGTKRTWFIERISRFAVFGPGTP